MAKRCKAGASVSWLRGLAEAQSSAYRFARNGSRSETVPPAAPRIPSAPASACRAAPRCPQTCANCGAENPPEARFCMECGPPWRRPLPGPAPRPRGRRLAPPSRPPRSAARRPSSSPTSPATRPRPSAWTPRRSRHWWTAPCAASAEEVERFGGSVDKFIGDNVMGVFGAPVAHEDDPERAVRAGLAMQEAMEEINRESEAPATGSASRCASGSTPAR